MKNSIKYILTASVLVLLTACGGGGGGEYGIPTPKISYQNLNGLTWSSTTSDILPNPPTSNGIGQIEVTASEYCSQSSCDANFSNCRPTNFNKQTGWTLPSETQLMQFCQAQLANPLEGWVRGQTWASCSGFNTCKTVDFGNACKVTSYINNALNFKASVTCVKSNI
jgi:hypothetical protein